MKLGMSYVLLELNIMAEAISGQGGGDFYAPPVCISLHCRDECPLKKTRRRSVS